MEPILSRSGCYCCMPSSSMDIDGALHELGMLSTVTDSRKQYIKEKEKSQNKPNSLDIANSNNSSSSSYKIMSINTDYVTAVSSAVINNTSRIVSPEDTSMGIEIGQSSAINVDNDGFKLSPGAVYNGYRDCETTKPSRFSRMKLARIRRYKKPYEVPWRVSASLSLSTPLLENTSSSKAFQTSPKPLPSLPKPVTPKKTTTGLSKSNTNTPEKSVNATVIIQRSRSMDDLNMEKLQIANFITEEKDIDSMSQELKDLQMHEYNIS